MKSNDTGEAMQVNDKDSEKAAPRDNGGPAFPCEIGFGCVAENMHQNGSQTALQYGMSLRDHFAGLAMQGFLSGHIAHHGHGSHWPYAGMASEAFDVADAMLAARRKA